MNLYRLEIPLGIFYKPIDLSSSGTAVLGVVGNPDLAPIAGEVKARLRAALARVGVAEG